MTIVVDASVAVKWVIPEVLSDQATALRDRADRVLAPDLLFPEAANALGKKLTRRESTAREATQAIALLMASGLDLRPSGPLLGRALALARRLRHPVYDLHIRGAGPSRARHPDHRRSTLARARREGADPRGRGGPRYVVRVRRFGG